MNKIFLVSFILYLTFVGFLYSLTPIQESNKMYSGNPNQNSSANAVFNLYGNPTQTYQVPPHQNLNSYPYPYYGNYYYYNNSGWPNDGYNYSPYVYTIPPPTPYEAFPDETRAQALYWSEVRRMQNPW